MARFYKGMGGHRFSEMLRGLKRAVPTPGALPEKGGSGPRGRGGEGPLRKKDSANPKPDAAARHMDGKPNRGGITNHPRVRSEHEMPRENLTQGNFGQPPALKTKVVGNPHFADEGQAETPHRPRPEPVRLGHHGEPPTPKRHVFGDQKRTGEHTQVDRSGAKHPAYPAHYPQIPTQSKQHPTASRIRGGAGVGGGGRGHHKLHMQHKTGGRHGSLPRRGLRENLTNLAGHI